MNYKVNKDNNKIKNEKDKVPIYVLSQWRVSGRAWTDPVIQLGSSILITCILIVMVVYIIFFINFVVNVNISISPQYFLNSYKVCNTGALEM